MYPSLYYFFKDLFGLDLPFLDIVKTYGFFLALSFFVASIWLFYYFKKLEDQEIFLPEHQTLETGGPIDFKEVLYNTIFGFLVGYKIGLLANSFELNMDMAEIIFSLQGSLIGGLIGALLLGGLAYYAAAKSASPAIQSIETKIYPHHRITEMIMIAAFFGVLGSKIFASVEDWDNFVKDPMGSLLSFQGLTFYGGFIFAAIALIFYCRKHKMPFLHFLDATAPALIIAYGVGRLGCHFSGDGDWGIVNSLPKPSWLPQILWAYNYPNNVAMEGQAIPGCVGIYCKELVPPVFPTSIYEFIMCVLIFIGLFLINKKLRIPGLLFGIYLILNGLERYFIETIRVNPDYTVGGSQYSQAQIIAILLVLLGIALSTYLLLTKPLWSTGKPAVK